jgi:hypothetical protein
MGQLSWPGHGELGLHGPGNLLVLFIYLNSSTGKAFVLRHVTFAMYLSPIWSSWLRSLDTDLWSSPTCFVTWLSPYAFALFQANALGLIPCQLDGFGRFGRRPSWHASNNNLILNLIEILDVLFFKINFESSSFDITSYQSQILFTLQNLILWLLALPLKFVKFHDLC